MAYWLPEEWHRSPEIDTVGTAAAGLYARCGSFIADSETDGFIPAARARMYGTAEWIERLVVVGWWSVVEGGYRDERYFANGNATRAEKQKRRADAAARQAKRRAVTRDSRVSHGARHAQLTKPPIPPPSGGRAREGLRAVPNWCGRCNKDTRMGVNDSDEYIPCPNCHPGRTA